MTTVQFTTVHARSTPATRIAGILSGAWHAVRGWRARKATVEILQSLDGRTLRDIGVDRSEIESIVYGKRDGGKRWYDANWRRCYRL